MANESLYYVIIEEYPELTSIDFTNGTIGLRDDSDGVGPYIEIWNYSKPIPEGLTLGKPTA
jgi:hypothetical protein